MTLDDVKFARLISKIEPNRRIGLKKGKRVVAFGLDYGPKYYLKRVDDKLVWYYNAKKVRDLAWGSALDIAQDAVKFLKCGEWDYLDKAS